MRGACIETAHAPLGALPATRKELDPLQSNSSAPSIIELVDSMAANGNVEAIWQVATFQTIAAQSGSSVLALCLPDLQQLFP